MKITESMSEKGGIAARRGATAAPEDGRRNEARRNIPAAKRMKIKV